MALAGHFSRMKMWRGRPETSGAPWCCEPGFSRTQGPRAPPTVAASTIPRLFMKRPPGMATRAGAAPREGSVAIKRLIERCAGLDVHKKSVTACVRVPGPGAGERTSETRTFSTTTAGLLVLRDWLTSFGVTVVGMESTGVLWKPVFYLLEDDFDCWLLNAQHLRNVPGRKTDVKDAAWIAELVEYGLVRPSFVPPKPIRQLRDLTRYRKAVIEEHTREAQRLHAVLQDAGIKLSSVATDILGRSGRDMLEAWWAGPTTRRSWPSWPGAGCDPRSPRCARRWRGGSALTTPCSSQRCWPVSTTPTRPSRGCPPRSSGRWPLSPSRWSCCGPSPGLTAGSPRSSWPRPVGTWPASPAPSTWPPGLGSPRATTSRPASTARAEPARATSGCARPSPRRPGGRHGPTTPT